jgi:amidase
MKAALVVTVSSLLLTAPAHAAPSPIEIEEATVEQLGRWLGEGKLTTRRLAELYLERIEAIDRQGPALRSVIAVNPDALAIADRLDAERKKGKVGPLHGIPILIKDNIDTADRMPTTAGSLALADSIARQDAFLVKRLRAAGALILGKTNLSEWANIRSMKSTSGWSARGGQVKNPYALDRSPCGSSSGTGAAVAASLAAVGVGTETDGSIVCPSSVNGLVGIKPTLGLVSRSGVIPIAHSQDTAGPMARTVADAALLLQVLAAVDPKDPATQAAAGHLPLDLLAGLAQTRLEGVRIGVARAGFFGYSPGADRLIEAAIADLAKLGAVIVDPADVPSVKDLERCELTVLLYELKADLNLYLGALGSKAKVRSLKDVIAFNEREREREQRFFGQDLFEAAEAKGPLTAPEYRQALSACRTAAREHGLDNVFAEHKLDAIVMPTNGPAWTIDLVNGDHYTGGSSSLAAVAGYPHLTVPAGTVFGLPVGLSLVGPAWSDRKLIGYGAAYERATRRRVKPRFLPSAELF